MKILLDTHIFIWAFREPHLLSASARNYLDNPDNLLFLSIASAREIQIQIDIGKLEFEEPLLEIIEFQRRVNNVQLLPIELRHINGLSRLPLHHRDPFDRLLLAQSNVEAMPLLSADAVFDAYDAQILR